MSTKYTMQEATFNLPDSDYVDTTVNVFKHNGENEHSFVVTRSERDLNLSLDQELKENLNKLERLGGKNILIEAVTKSYVNDSQNNAVPALLAEYSFELQGKTHYQQQLVTETKINGQVTNMLVFTYTQSTPFPIDGESLDRLLHVWDSVVLTDQ